MKTTPFLRRDSSVPMSMYCIQKAMSPPGRSNTPWHLMTWGESVRRRMETSRRICRRTAGSLSPWTTLRA